MSAPEVSIVIPNFNKARFLAAAIDSVLAQGPETEAIFVDDRSTDGSAEILRRAAGLHPHLNFIQSSKQIGGSGCRNLGLDAARGRFVMFLDSDDLLASNCCTERLRVARSDPDHDLWIFPMSVFADDPARPIDRWTPRPGKHLENFLAHRLDWHTMQPLWRTSFVRAIGGFDAAFPRLQDPEVHTKALLHGARVKLCMSMEPDCHYRVAAERHESDVTELARRHVAGTLRFCETFEPQIGHERLPLLTGTLLACQGVLIQWWRSGRLPTPELDQLHRRMLRACRLSSHRLVLDLSFRLQRASPRHIPGTSRIAKALLGLP